MENYNLTQLNVLIVEDNRHMRGLLKAVLYSFGVKNIVECEDGVSAISELKNFEADLIISDWNMDILDGLELTRIIRAGKEISNPLVPIIMLTGHTELNRVMQARDAGVHEFLMKPFSPLALYKRICRIIEFPRDFVKCALYAGPDRRRQVRKMYKGDERRVEIKGTAMPMHAGL